MASLYETFRRSEFGDDYERMQSDREMFDAGEEERYRSEEINYGIDRGGLMPEPYEDEYYQIPAKRRCQCGLCTGKIRASLPVQSETKVVGLPIAACDAGLEAA